MGPSTTGFVVRVNFLCCSARIFCLFVFAGILVFEAN